jgi:hypothetical protein
MYYQIGVIILGYLLYPALSGIFRYLPPPNGFEGEYFFTMMSVVYGTLTATTISDASSRRGKLRAVVVDEVSSILPLIRRLEIALVLTDAEIEGAAYDDKLCDVLQQPSNICGVNSVRPTIQSGLVSDKDEERKRVFVECVVQLWGHIRTLIAKSRNEELELVAGGQEDNLLRVLEVLALADRKWGIGGPNLEFLS